MLHERQLSKYNPKKSFFLVHYLGIIIIAATVPSKGNNTMVKNTIMLMFIISFFTNFDFSFISVLYSIIGRITSRKYFYIHLLGQTKKMKMTFPKEIYNQKGRKTTLRSAQILSVGKLPNLKWRKESGCHIRIFWKLS